MSETEVPMSFLVDGLIACTLLEGLALTAYHHRTGKGIAPSEFATNMASGLCLMGALRCLATGTGAGWIAAFIVMSGATHGADLWRRWQRRPQPAASNLREIA